MSASLMRRSRTTASRPAGSDGAARSGDEFGDGRGHSSSPSFLALTVIGSFVSGGISGRIRVQPLRSFTDPPHKRLALGLDDRLLEVLLRHIGARGPFRRGGS